MSRKGENIRKRKDGRWEGRYKKNYNENGTIVFGSVYGKTYKEVREKLYSRIQSSVESKTDSVSRKITLQELLEKWLMMNCVRLKRGTVTKYCTMIQTHIAPELGSIILSDLTIPRVNAFLAQKLQSGRINGTGGLSPSYVRSIALILTSALNFAVQEEWCKPFKSKISKPAIHKDELKILSIEKQRVLEDYIKNALSPTNVGIMISLYTGLRIGEICALMWNDIDLIANTLTVNHTISRVKTTSDSERKTELIVDRPKTQSSKRRIPIPSPLQPVLKEYKKIANSSYVVSNTDTFISPRTYEARYHRVLSICSIDAINYHSLRHTFATRCIEAGVDIKSLSEILGHSNVSITLNTYVHSSFEMKRNQLEKLALI